MGGAQAIPGHPAKPAEELRPARMRMLWGLPYHLMSLALHQGVETHVCPCKESISGRVSIGQAAGWQQGDLHML